MLSLNIYPGPADPSQTLHPAYHHRVRDPSLDSVACCLLLMAGGPVSLKLTCVQLSQMHNQIQTHIHVEDCIITSITSNLLHASAHPQACLTSSCSLRIALQMVQNKLAEQSTQELCIGAMSCHVQAEHHLLSTRSLCRNTHTL